eukprot:scaffold68114_cov58-Phaeocystis_antarctica.AAC.2
MKGVASSVERTSAVAEASSRRRAHSVRPSRQAQCSAAKPASTTWSATAESCAPPPSVERPGRAFTSALAASRILRIRRSPSAAMRQSGVRPSANARLASSPLLMASRTPANTRATRDAHERSAEVLCWLVGGCAHRRSHARQGRSPEGRGLRPAWWTALASRARPVRPSSARLVPRRSWQHCDCRARCRANIGDGRQLPLWNFDPPLV